MDTSSETYTYEGTTYLNPDTSRDEQLAFVDNLRATQEANNAQIAQDTHNLGTDVASALGGLNGSEGYFASRYQTPQVDSLVADLKTAAQYSALSTALNNISGEWSDKYNSVYDSVSSSSGSSSDDSSTGTTDYSQWIEGMVNVNSSTGTTGTVTTDSE